MIRKYITIIVLILVLSPLGSATAQKSEQVNALSKESKRESVEELLNIINAESVIENLYSQMGQMLQGMGKQLGVKPSEQELFDGFMKKMISLMQEEMSWAKMKEPMIKIYMKHYTEKEIQDQIVFYKSESGQSMISKQGDVATDTLMLSQQMVQNFIPKLKEMTEEFEAELAAKRNNKE